MAKKGPKGPYDVGYGKPPKHTQFQPGQSGHRGGRPKGRKNFSTELHEALNAPVIVTENGKRKKISKRKAAAVQLANKAAAGDPKTMSVLIQHDTRFEESRAAAEAAQPGVTAEEDRKTIENIVKRMREAQAAPSRPELTPEQPAEAQISTPEPEEGAKL